MPFCSLATSVSSLLASIAQLAMSPLHFSTTSLRPLSLAASPLLIVAAAFNSGMLAVNVSRVVSQPATTSSSLGMATVKLLIFFSSEWICSGTRVNKGGTYKRGLEQARSHCFAASPPR